MRKDGIQTRKRKPKSNSTASAAAVAVVNATSSNQSQIEHQSSISSLINQSAHNNESSSNHTGSSVGKMDRLPLDCHKSSERGKKLRFYR